MVSSARSSTKCLLVVNPKLSSVMVATRIYQFVFEDSEDSEADTSQQNSMHPMCKTCNPDWHLCLACGLDPNKTAAPSSSQQAGPPCKKGHTTFYGSVPKPAKCDSCGNQIAQNTMYVFSLRL